MAHNPESGPGNDAAKIDLIKKLKELVNKILGKKALEAEIEHGVEKYKEEREKYETKEKRDEALFQEELKDKTRQYHQVKSAQVAEIEAELATKIRAGQIAEKLDHAVEDTKAEIPEGAAYFIDTIRIEPEVQEAE